MPGSTTICGTAVLDNESLAPQEDLGRRWLLGTGVGRLVPSRGRVGGWRGGACPWRARIEVPTEAMASRPLVGLAGSEPAAGERRRAPCADPRDTHRGGGEPLGAPPPRPGRWRAYSR